MDLFPPLPDDFVLGALVGVLSVLVPFQVAQAIGQQHRAQNKRGRAQDVESAVPDRHTVGALNKAGEHARAEREAGSRAVAEDDAQPKLALPIFDGQADDPAENGDHDSDEHCHSTTMRVGPAKSIFAAPPVVHPNIANCPL